MSIIFKDFPVIVILCFLKNFKRGSFVKEKGYTSLEKFQNENRFYSENSFFGWLGGFSNYLMVLASKNNKAIAYSFDKSLNEDNDLFIVYIKRKVR